MSFIQRVKHCIFDFDGVIINSEIKKFNDLKKVLSKYDYKLKDKEFNNFIGKKRAYFLKEKNISLINKNLEKIMFEIREKDFELDQYKLINGLIDFLKFLDKHNISSHIATGSSEEFVIKILEHFKIKNYFNHIVTGKDVSKSKPLPDIYIEMKKRIKNESAFVIEDSPAGVISAKKAGLFVISFIKHENADIVVSDFSELINKLS